MKQIAAIFLVGVLLTVLAGCGAQKATLRPTADGRGIEVERSFWANTEPLGELAINLAKAKNTTPDNAVDMTTAANTRVSISQSTWIREWRNTYYQSDLDQRARELARIGVEAGQPKQKEKAP